MKKIYTAVLFSLIAVLSACDRDYDGYIPAYIESDPDPKTFIMFGDIDSFSGNISDAGRSVAAGVLKEGQQVVYYQYTENGGDLYRLVQNTRKAAGYESVLVKSYDDGGISGFDKTKLRAIIEDAMAAAPANHYGLSVGSHGRGWIPFSLWSTRSAQAMNAGGFGQFFEFQEGSPTRYMFGNSYARRIETEDFAEALSGLDLDFIILDQCLMGGIENMYEFRNLAPYIITSPTEIMFYGFPYDKVVRRLFSDWEDLQGVCEAFMAFYRGYVYPYGTTALIKTSEIPALAQAVRSIAQAEGGAFLYPAGGVSSLQYYEGLPTHLFYDFGQYISTATSNASLLTAFEEALDNVVIYKDHTERFFSAFPVNVTSIHLINGDHYSGLSAYVPDLSTAAFTVAYQETSWYKAVYGI